MAEVKSASGDASLQLDNNRFRHVCKDNNRAGERTYCEVEEGVGSAAAAAGWRAREAAGGGRSWRWRRLGSVRPG